MSAVKIPQALQVPSATVVAISTIAATPLIIWVYKYLAQNRQRAQFRKYTAIDNLYSLGQPRAPAERLKGTAVVIGGSIAGILTARVCADHFEQVVIIEADDGADTENPTSGLRDIGDGLKAHKSRRTRVHQIYSQHVYQPYLLYALRRLFPDWDNLLAQAGGRMGPFLNSISDFGTSKLFGADPLYPGGKGLPYHPLLPTDVVPESFWLSRTILEPMLRRLVLERCSNISTINGIANGLNLDDTKTSVHAVTYTRKGETDIHRIDAAFVADCTGPVMGGLKWLTRAGVPPVKVQTYHPHYKGVTLRVKVPPALRAKLPLVENQKSNHEAIFVIFSDFHLSKFVNLLRAEGDTLIIGLNAHGQDIEPFPRTVEDIIALTNQMALDENGNGGGIYSKLLDMILNQEGQEAKPEIVYDEGAAATCTFAEYVDAKSLPGNYVALGDAAMRSNPTFGFGCTKSSIEAATLDGLLRSQRREKSWDPLFSKRYFKTVHPRINTVWSTTKDNDYARETTIPCEGEKLEDAYFKTQIGKSLIQVASKDPTLAARLWVARWLIYPPSAAIGLGDVARAYWHWKFVG